MYIGSPFVANAPLKCGRRLLHSAQRWTSRSQTGKQFPNDADSAWSSADQIKVQLSHEELALLLGGIDLRRAKRRRWYRRGVAEEPAA
jgi:hypothetical protein